MKKSHKIVLIAVTLIMAGIVGYILFQKSNGNDTYVARGEECKYIDYACEPGKEHFYDGIGCGCK